MGYVEADGDDVGDGCCEGKWIGHLYRGREVKLMERLRGMGLVVVVAMVTRSGLLIEAHEP